MVSVYGNFLPTESKIIYETDPRFKSQINELLDPEIVDFTFGDETVSTASALIPAIKWADDFSKGIKGAKPVIFLEMCSNINQIDSIFKTPGEFTVLENFYSGVACKSKKGVLKKESSQGFKHGHSGMLDHKNLQSIILQAANQSIENSNGIQGKFQHFDEQQWEEYASQCKLLIRD